MQSSSRVTAAPGVVFQELEQELVLLNMERETYFGLDEVGARFWFALTTEPSLEAAEARLLAEYDVEGSRLTQDLERFIADLLDRQLIRIDA